MAIKRFHKTVFALTAVIVPLYWLTLTQDGQRRVDSAMLWLAGKPGIDVNLKALDHRLNETELSQVYPDLHWQCADQPSAFGQRMCAVDIGTFNGLPARAIRFYFADGRATAMKLAYRGVYHDPLIQQLVQQFGAADTGSPDAEVIQWTKPNGILVLKRRLLEGDEAALLWLAAPLTIN